IGQGEVAEIEDQGLAGRIVEPDGRITFAQEVGDTTRFTRYWNANAVRTVGVLNFQFRREYGRDCGVAASLGIRVAAIPSLDGGNQTGDPFFADFHGAADAPILQITGADELLASAKHA